MLAQTTSVQMLADCPPLTGLGLSVSRRICQGVLGYITYTGQSQSTYTETVGRALLDGPVFNVPAGPVDMAAGTELRAERGATTVDTVADQGDQAGNDPAPTSVGYATYEAIGSLAVPLLRNLEGAESLADTDPNLIPDLCYSSVSLRSPLCGLITPVAGGGTAGQISSILARDENIGAIKSDGVDFSASVKAPTPVGDLVL
jgi:hypothetical protein